MAESAREDGGDGLEVPFKFAPTIKRAASFSSPRVIRRNDFTLSLRCGVWSIQGDRKTQEDAHAAVPELEPKPTNVELPFAFFGIYDGHGGRDCSDFVCDQLHYAFLEESQKIKNKPSVVEGLEEALRKSILRVEDEYMARAERAENGGPEESSGTTVAVVVIQEDHLIVGNVGDSEVVLSEDASDDEDEEESSQLDEDERSPSLSQERVESASREKSSNNNSKKNGKQNKNKAKRKAIMITEIHNPKKNKAEKQRVRRAGGTLYRDRIGHPAFNPALISIAVSRAIGDFCFKADRYTGGKRSGLIADPHISHVRLIPHRHKFCVLACDGVWDVLSGQEVVDFVSELLIDERQPPEEAAKALVEYAYDQGSTDNITALVVAFDWSQGSDGK